MVLLSPCSIDGGRGGYTSVDLRILRDLYGVVCREDTTSPCSHVVTLVPVILWLHLHQQRIVHLQLQLIIVPRDKPDDTEGVRLYRLIIGQKILFPASSPTPQCYTCYISTRSLTLHPKFDGIAEIQHIFIWSATNQHWSCIYTK